MLTYNRLDARADAQPEPRADARGDTRGADTRGPFGDAREAFGDAGGRIDIKLFVGRVPTSATEETLRPLFEQAGEVIEVAIIRDKPTGAHKGCAFVRMASITDADAAIRALNQRPLEAAQRPVEGVCRPPLEGGSRGVPLFVTYATGEPERLGFLPGSLIPGEDSAKLFVGSLPRDATDLELLDFFSSYGKVYDAFLMHDAGTRRCKGCGFIKFALKEEALLAIKQLHGIVTFPRAQRRLEVRVAAPKKMHVATPAPLQNAAQPHFPHQQTQQYHQQTQTQQSNWQGIGPAAAAAAAAAASLEYGRSGGGGSLQQSPLSQANSDFIRSTFQPSTYRSESQSPFHPFLETARDGEILLSEEGGRSYFSPAGPFVAPDPPSNANPRSAGFWKEYFTQDGKPYYHNEQTNCTQWSLPPEFIALNNQAASFQLHLQRHHNLVHLPNLETHQQNSSLERSSPKAAGRSYGSTTPVGGVGITEAVSNSKSVANPSLSVALSHNTGTMLAGGGGSGVSGDQTGPPGANIFVFHVPNEWGRRELAEHFASFGRVLSAKVAIDNVTGRNRGFGFVSYDDIGSAIEAVKKMNFAVVSNKRLRVAIKNGEEEFARAYVERAARAGSGVGVGASVGLGVAAGSAYGSTAVSAMRPGMAGMGATGSATSASSSSSSAPPPLGNATGAPPSGGVGGVLASGRSTPIFQENVFKQTDFLITRNVELL